MAYSKVGTPRFYINLVEWMGVNKRSEDSKYKLRFHAENIAYQGSEEQSNWTDKFQDIFRTYPKGVHSVNNSIGVDFVQQEEFEQTNYNLLDHGDGGNGFIAFLGHRFTAGNDSIVTVEAARDIRGGVYDWGDAGEQYYDEGVLTVTLNGPYPWLGVPLEPADGDRELMSPDGQRGYFSGLHGFNDNKFHLEDKNENRIYWDSQQARWINDIGELTPGESYRFISHIYFQDDFTFPTYGTLRNLPWTTTFESINIYPNNYGGHTFSGYTYITHPYPFEVTFTQIFDMLVNTGQITYDMDYEDLPIGAAAVMTRANLIVRRDHYESGWGIIGSYITLRPGEGFVAMTSVGKQITWFPIDGRGGGSNRPGVNWDDVDLTPLVNCELSGSNSFTARKSGFSISSFNGLDIGRINIKVAGLDPDDVYADSSCSSIVVGSFYDMPYGPETSLSMSNELDGISVKRGMGGNNFTNYNYIKPSDWNDKPAWHLYEISDMVRTSDELHRVFDPQVWSYGESEIGHNYGEGNTPYTFQGNRVFFNTLYNPVFEPYDDVITLQLNDIITPGVVNLIHFKVTGNQHDVGDSWVDNTTIVLDGYYYDASSFYTHDDSVAGGEINIKKPIAYGTSIAMITNTGNLLSACVLEDFYTHTTEEILEDTKASRIGRRTWDLEFNYLSDSDIFPNISSLTNYETTSPDGIVWDSEMAIEENTLTQQSTFFSHVIHKTNGGQLPFIFQPDNTNFNPDSFAICKFDMKTFEFEQISNGVYNIKIKIREVW